MLSKKEKAEFIEDGYSPIRRKNFPQAKKLCRKTPSLDEYIQFLIGIQKIFSSFPNPRRRRIAHINKL